MKKISTIILLCLSNYVFAQMKETAVTANLSAERNDLKMTSTYGFKDKELLDWMRFDNLDYYQIKFTGTQLKTKTYQITVKEIWNGKVKSESVVVNSKELKEMGLDQVGDTVLNMKVMGKQTADNKLRLSFMFPRFSNTKVYKAVASKDYSLRNLADESRLDIGYHQGFHFLAYILPYERKDGSKSWCEVGSSGKDVENWGKKFGIKHYLLFEMKFE